MSEIVLRMNRETGNVEKVQVVGGDEETQLDGIKRLQFYMAEINQFSQRVAESARLYNSLKGMQSEHNTV